VGALLAHNSANWQAQDARDFIKYASDWGLTSFFADWWDVEPSCKTAVVDHRNAGRLQDGKMGHIGGVYVSFIIVTTRTLPRDWERQ
jgi:hypothetical protein